MPEATLYEVAQGAAWITLNRPENRNALSAALVAELDAHLTAANADPAVRCIVITGADPAFCAGADLKSPPGSSPLGDMRAVTFPEVLQHIIDSDKPVIAAVNGAAYAGGLGIVGAADIVIMAQDAPCAFSEVRIGVIPAIIAVTCLPKLGPHHAMRLFLTGERFDAADQHRDHHLMMYNQMLQMNCRLQYYLTKQNLLQLYNNMYFLQLLQSRWPASDLHPLLQQQHY